MDQPKGQWKYIVQVPCQVFVNFLSDFQRTRLSDTIRRPVTSPFVFHTSSFLCLFKDTFLSTPYWGKFLANSSQGITLLLEKYSFVPPNFVIFGIFQRFDLKRGEQIYVFAKGQIVWYVQTHHFSIPWIRGFLILERFMSLLSGLTKQPKLKTFQWKFSRLQAYKDWK